MRLTSLELDNTVLARLVSAVGGRRLRELVLWVRALRLTVEALRAVGQCCPALQRLELAERFNLQELGTQGPRLFENLRVLRLLGAQTMEYADADKERYVYPTPAASSTFIFLASFLTIVMSLSGLRAISLPCFASACLLSCAYVGHVAMMTSLVLLRNVISQG